MSFSLAPESQITGKKKQKKQFTKAHPEPQQGNSISSNYQHMLQFLSLLYNWLG